MTPLKRLQKKVTPTMKRFVRKKSDTNDETICSEKLTSINDYSKKMTPYLYSIIM